MKNDVDKLTSSLKNLEQKLKRLEEKISNLESTRKPTREQKNTKIKEKNKQ
jgi:flagellar biosynthesis chaperone FliJ